ncbi:MAG: hypothetical protein JST83_04995 [Bacteroidetes bacterium]|nr:hypothetical protein [Bacteroidota bacterium]
MKYCPLICAFLVLLASCRPHIQETDTISERGPDSLYAAYLVMARGLPDSLNKFSPFIITSTDSGNVKAEVGNEPYLAIGDLFNNRRTYALYCSNVSDTNALIRLYVQIGNSWRTNGQELLPFFVGELTIHRNDLDKGIVFSGINSDHQKVKLDFPYNPEQR